MDTLKPLMSLIDTLHMSFYLSALNLTEDEFKYLDACKQRRREAGVTALNDRIEFKDKFFYITSARKIYAWVLYNDDLTIKIARKLSNGKYPELYVEFRSRFLMRNERQAYESIKKWIETWAVISSEKVSRADLATDFEGGNMIDMDNIVMRCRKSSTYFEEDQVKEEDEECWSESWEIVEENEELTVEEFRECRKITGYKFGAGSVLLRTYDKTLEIKKSKKQYIKSEWDKQGWDKTSPVWRVEYQLQRDFLKQFRIETFDSLLDRAGTMWDYLTHYWFTVRQPSETDSTRSRWLLSENWQIVCESFTQRFGRLTGIVRDKIKQVSLDNLIPQAAGGITSCLALMGKKGRGIIDLFNMIERYYSKKEKNIAIVVREKVKRYAFFEESIAGLLRGA